MKGRSEVDSRMLYTVIFAGLAVLLVVAFVVQKSRKK
jgi:hypothetical protein